jgi:acyl-CoA thioesterase-2
LVIVGDDGAMSEPWNAAPKIDDVVFDDLLELEPHGPDTFVGISAKYPWGKRLFGGQVVAQALAAATATVDPDPFRSRTSP